MTTPPQPDRRNHSELRQHFDKRFDEITELIKSGFPDGDPGAHRRVHEQYIKDAKDREEVRLAVKKSVFSSGVWLFLLTIAAAVASYFGLEVKK